MQYKCYVNSCQMWQIQILLLENFWDLKKNTFDVQMQNALKQRGKCMPKQL